jgi:hypothetical protein
MGERSNISLFQTDDFPNGHDLRAGARQPEQ